MAKSSRPVNVVLWPPEKIDGHYDRSGERLPFPCLRVIAETVYRPQEQRWHYQVIEPEQPHQQAHLGVEHVLRAADKVMAGQDSADKI